LLTTAWFYVAFLGGTVFFDMHNNPVTMRVLSVLLGGAQQIISGSVVLMRGLRM
jgi:hypothetical protein